MKEGIFPTEVMNPLTAPATRPTTQAISTAPGIPTPWFAMASAAQIPERAIIAPTERSMLPEMMTAVCPQARMAIAAACTRICLRLSRS